MNCECEEDYLCPNCPDPAEYWAAYFGARPASYDATEAYEPTDYKSRFWRGW